MRSALLPLFVLAPVSVDAQSPVEPPTRAFEQSAIVSLSRRYFGGRQEVRGAATAKYQVPLGVDVTVQLPWSRRVGFDFGATLYAGARQRSDEGMDTRVSAGSFTHAAVRGAIAWRFKPFVPVYLFAGGGVARAAKFAAFGLPGSATEPELNFGFGIDPRRHGGSGLRLRYLASVAYPDDPHVPGVTARGPAYDWSLQAGWRLPLFRHSVRSTP